MENSNALGEILKKTARERRLSLRNLGKLLGISHGYVRKLMQGVDTRNNKSISPSIDVVLRIADALEIPRIEFLRQCGYLDK